MSDPLFHTKRNDFDNEYDLTQDTIVSFIEFQIHMKRINHSHKIKTI